MLFNYKSLYINIYRISNIFSLFFRSFFRIVKMAVFIVANYRRDGFVSSWSKNAFGLLKAFTSEIQEKRFLSLSFLPPPSWLKWRKRAVNVLREETFVEVMYPHTPRLENSKY